MIYYDHSAGEQASADSDKISLMPIVAAIVGLLVMVGCMSAQVPESSLTGKIHEVKIGEVITPKEVITAETGDEVRWVNTKSSPVHLTLKKPMSARLSCRKGFSSTEGFEFVGSPDPDVLLTTTSTVTDSLVSVFPILGYITMQ